MAKIRKPNLVVRAGLQEAFHGMKLSDIAAKYGVTQQAVSLWDIKAMTAIRKAFAKDRAAGEIDPNDPEDAREFFVAFERGIAERAREDAIAEKVAARAAELMRENSRLCDSAAVRLAMKELIIEVDGGVE